MCGGGTPPPDPGQTAQLQNNINQDAIKQTAQVNQVNQNNPFGSLNYSGTIGSDTDPRTQNVTLNPQLQNLLTGQEGISQGLTDAAQSRIAGLGAMDQFQLPTAGAPDAATQDVSGGVYKLGFDPGGQIQAGINPNAGLLTNNVAQGPIQTQLNTAGVQSIAGPGAFANQQQQAQQAAYQGQAGLLQPGFDQATQHLQSQLAAQGIDQTSPAYAQAMDNLQRSQGSTLQQAAASAVGLGNAQQGQLFGENLAGSNAQFGQALSGAQYGLSAQGQQFGQGTSNAQLNNSAVGQQFGQNVTAQQANNAAQQQQFGQNAALAQFYNQSLNSEQAQNLQIGQYNQNLYQQQLQDQILGRNQNFNEASAFLNGSPVAPSNPNFAPTTQYQPAQASPNAIGLAGQNYQTQEQANAAILGSVFGAIGNVGAAAIPKCWVAREVYGVDNPRWLEMREWMSNKAPHALREMYMVYGPCIAEYIRDKSELKASIREQMDAVLGGQVEAALG